MKRVARNIAILVLAAAFGPVTSGYPLVQYLCSMGGPMPPTCSMAVCDEEAPSGAAISSPECCTVLVLSADVSTHFVKTDLSQDLSGPILVPVADLTVLPTTFSSGSVNAVPAVTAHDPPLYIAHSALLL